MISFVNQVSFAFIDSTGILVVVASPVSRRESLVFFLFVPMLLAVVVHTAHPIKESVCRIS